MINLTKLSNKEKELLRKMVLYSCEQCSRLEDEVGPLEIHRIRQGHMGGIYHLRNIKVLCKKCHQMYHANNYNHLRSR